MQSTSLPCFSKSFLMNSGSSLESQGRVQLLKASLHAFGVPASKLLHQLGERTPWLSVAPFVEWAGTACLGCEIKIISSYLKTTSRKHALYFVPCGETRCFPTNGCSSKARSEISSSRASGHILHLHANPSLLSQGWSSL